MRWALVWLFTSAMFLVFQFPVQADDEVGLFFDLAGTVNCLSDSTIFPFAIESYLVLRDCSSAQGIAGWEGSFSYPESIVMVGWDLGDNSLNISQPPEFVVGLATPIAQAPLLVLGTFSFIVNGPGEIYFHAPEQSSLSGNFYPLYVAGINTQTTTLMNYSFGSPLHPVSTIGLETCPEDSLLQEEFNVDPSPWEEVPHDKRSEGILRDSNRGDAEVSLPDDFKEFWQKYDIGVLGTVRNFERHCLYYIIGELEVPTGVVEIDIDISEVYWAPKKKLSKLTLWVKNTDVEGCMRYSPSLRFYAAEELAPGATIVAFANFRDGALWGTKQSVFINSPEKSSILSEGHFSKLEKLASLDQFSFEAGQSDLIGIFRSAPGEYSYETLAVFGGKRELENSEIKIINQHGLLAEGEKILCFLKKLEGNRKYKLVKSHRNPIRIKESGLFNIRNMPLEYLGSKP